MSITPTSFNPQGYQENFNPNIPYADFYNTPAFAAGLDKNTGFYIQQSDKAHERSQQEINEVFNSDSQTPVVI